MLDNDTSPSTSQKTIYLKDYQVPDFLIPSVHLEFFLEQEKTRLVSTLTVTRNGDHQRPLVLDGERMKLVSLSLNGAAVEYQLTATSLELEMTTDSAELIIETELKPAENTQLSGLYQSSGNFCTQCEAEGFRRITYFLDRPDVLSVYDVVIHADKSDYPVLLSNGNPKGRGDHENDKHWAHWHDPHPKPSYLFALVAGDLKHISDQFITASGTPVELNIYTQAHNIDKCGYAMTSLKNSMAWDERVYGREYDLDIYNIVAVDDFNMGAMENKGLNIFNSKYVLADQQTATDADYHGIERVIGHEYFHNWSGNRVTCRDWFQLSLKEGFTVFRDQQFSADMGSPSVNRIDDVAILRAYQFKEDAGPMAHPVRPDSYQEINNFYTATVYNKGAEVIRMLFSLLGQEKFRKGSDLYFQRFDGQAVTTEDFVVSMEQANDIDLSQFRHWYSQSGTPSVSIESEFNNGTLKITAKQTLSDTPGQTAESKQPFFIPIAIALFSSDGEKIKEEVLVLEQSHQVFEIGGLEQQPLVSVLRDFSAPIKLTIERFSDELAQLVAVDDNGFARWEAMQELYLRVLLPAIDRGYIADEDYKIVLETLETLILSAPKDKAVFAKMLQLPDEAYIAELCQPIKPLAITQLRKQLLQRMARDLESQFHAVYANNNHGRGFDQSGQAVAERALKNTALRYLVATEQAAYHALASHQYHIATNMTDRLAAFNALLNSAYHERDVLLQDFYQTWQNETLVLDKWFALQAMSNDEDALENVKQLCEHPAFAITNPNKARSLIGAFTNNLQAFHQTSGAGYEFVADKVIELNTLNPQMAARIVGVFNNWRSMVEPHAEKMQKQLERISKHEGLATDIKEIVVKALQEAS